MSKVGILATLSLAIMAPHAASAQNGQFYDCRDRPVRVSIASMRLEDAVAAFSKQTKCPVSWDVTKVGNTDAADVTTTITRGRYRPAQALRLMLRNTPFKSKTIKGGFSVYQ